MTAEAIANLLQARRSGKGKWQARCPAHGDRHPSLSISEGREGRTLLHCWSGCQTDDILKASHLAMRDLFEGQPPSPERTRRLAVARTRRDLETKARRQESRSACDRVRKLFAVVDALGRRLAELPDGGQDSDALALLFHHSLAVLREAEVALEVMP